MRVLVTGARGFLGSEIVRQARESGWSVRATDRADAPRRAADDYYRADVLHPESLLPVMNGMESVIHAAGLAHVFGQTQVAAAPFGAVNGTGTLNVACMASQAGVKHFVLVSSVAIYGSGSRGEVESVCHPEGPYAESKWEAEQRAIEVARETGMQVTILRLATLYGEGDPGNIARLMRLIDQGRFVWIGDGSNRKSLIYRDDAARACLAVIGRPRAGVNVYNVSAPPCTVRDLVEELASALERRLPPWQVPASLALWLTGIAARLSGDRGPFSTVQSAVQKWLTEDVYDGSKFERDFDFQPRGSLQEGLRREVAWYRGRA